MKIADMEFAVMQSSIHSRLPAFREAGPATTPQPEPALVSPRSAFHLEQDWKNQVGRDIVLKRLPRQFSSDGLARLQAQSRGTIAF